MSKYKIGLFGFGCVGQGFYETLQENSQIDAEVVKICVKNSSKQRSISTEKFVYEREEIFNDSSVNMIVEVIDDADAAFQVVKEALTQRKPVVSANKKMIAEHLDELILLQKEYNTPLLYEGAVCGSIPVLKNLEEFYNLEEVREIKGIFNGSTNYILTKVIEENKTYIEALEAAQVNGFAESDPTLDVEGYDAKYKLGIVLQHAFGLYVHPERLFNQGIQNITKSDIAFAFERGLKIKLLARATRQGQKVSAFVAPHFVNEESPLYHVENEYNAVLIEGKFAGEQVLIGKGAGKLPTGLAVLSDVKSLVHGNHYRHDKIHAPGYEASIEEVYVSFENGKTLDFSLFNRISEKYIGQKSGYAIGEIRLENLKSLVEDKDVNVIFTSGAKEEIEVHRSSYSYI